MTCTFVGAGFGAGSGVSFDVGVIVDGISTGFVGIDLAFAFVGSASGGVSGGDIAAVGGDFLTGEAGFDTGFDGEDLVGISGTATSFLFSLSFSKSSS